MATLFHCLFVQDSVDALTSLIKLTGGLEGTSPDAVEGTLILIETANGFVAGLLMIHQQKRLDYHQLFFFFFALYPSSGLPVCPIHLLLHTPLFLLLLTSSPFSRTVVLEKLKSDILLW